MGRCAVHAGEKQPRGDGGAHGDIIGRCASWGIGETGAAGPAGNRYGDPAGHACLAVSGGTERAITLRTASSERLANMHAFAAAALQLFEECLVAS